MSTHSTVKAPARTGMSAATRATYVASIGCGLAFASWASRIPQVRDRLQLTSAGLGLVLVTIAGYRQAAVLGTLGLGAFLTAMTIGRWFADGLLARYGRVRVIRGQTVLTIAGVLVFVFSPATPWPLPACCCGEWAPRLASLSA